LLEDFGRTDRCRHLDIDDDRVDVNEIVVRIGEERIAESSFRISS
jgi:hypothetical protein